MNGKTNLGLNPSTPGARCGFVLLVALFVSLPFDLPAQKTKSPFKRQAILHMSDGEQREGIIELSRGIEFSLTNLERNDTGANAPVE